MSGPFRHEVEMREIAEVNVVPLADVSLVLLIMLLVLSPMMAQSMLRVSAAAESSAPPISQRDPTPPPPPELVLVVGLQPGVITVGERIFKEPSSFVAHMRDALSTRTDKKVFLSPSGEVATGQVVVMLETLKACGASSVSLVQIQEALSTPAPGQTPPSPTPGQLPAVQAVPMPIQPGKQEPPRGP
ncbi:MAG: biopolymer transporter ExbD [Elusimicrobia bacterium]|nr:biopolymer transporter ExbD [Elusimicrobiota bacterium]